MSDELGTDPVTEWTSSSLKMEIPSGAVTETLTDMGPIREISTRMFPLIMIASVTLRPKTRAICIPLQLWIPTDSDSTPDVALID